MRNTSVEKLKVRINIKNLDKDILSIMNDLNISMDYNTESPSDSIMSYNILCECDDGFLCDHRLEYIIKKLSSIIRRVKLEKLDIKSENRIDG